MKNPSPLFRVVALVTVASMLGSAPGPSQNVNAASHREAPSIALDPAADITDFFMFRSYEPGKDDRVILIMNVFPGGEPGSGPNYFSFDPTVLYSFYIDSDRDGVADDTTIDIQFNTEIRGVNDQLGLFLSYVALPPITALTGNGSEGLGLRQKYSVTFRQKGPDQRFNSDQTGQDLIVVPSNVGPRTTPGYGTLAGQGVYTLGNGVRVFAGQRGDPFYIDLGALFDTVNLRRNPPLLTASEDANDTINPFGIDMIGTFNVQTIALEVPASLLTLDGKGPSQTAHPRLGAYAGTSRNKVTVLRGAKHETKTSGPWIQVQRLANPLINEAIIGTKDKDRWNALSPEDEKEFLDYYLNPRLATALQLIFGVPAATSGRQDLVDLLLKYNAGDNRLSELLRLNVSVPPTLLATQKRMTVLASPTDPAGWPNGRRPKDDVTDIAVRVVGGSNYIAARAGDGVNTHAAPTSTAFPFLATPQNGRDRVHQNP